MANLPKVAAASAREALRSRGLRQQDVARMLGLKQQSVSDRMTGKTPLTLAEVGVIAEYLGVTVAELLEPPAVLVDEPTAVAS